MKDCRSFALQQPRIQRNGVSSTPGVVIERVTDSRGLTREVHRAGWYPVYQVPQGLRVTLGERLRSGSEEALTINLPANVQGNVQVGKAGADQRPRRERSGGRQVSRTRQGDAALGVAMAIAKDKAEQAARKRAAKEAAKEAAEYAAMTEAWDIRDAALSREEEAARAAAKAAKAAAEAATVALEAIKK